MTHHDRPDQKRRAEKFVYFARAQISGLIKIGFSQNPDARASGLCAETGEEVRVLFTIPGNRIQEKGYQKRFQECRARGEWFYEAGRLHEFLKGRGHGGTKTVIQKQVLVQAGPSRIIEVLKHPIDGAQRVPQLVGYARVSTDDQNLDVQLRALTDGGVRPDQLFVEKLSALNAKRPQFRLMMKYLEAGDTLIVHSLSRLGRDVRQIHHILDQLSAEGVTWRSVTEPHLDNSTAAGRLMLNVTGAMAQFERDQIKERTKRGMDECKRKGMYLGRPELVTDADVDEMKKLRKAKVSVKKIAKKYGIKPSTVYARTNKKKAA